MRLVAPALGTQTAHEDVTCAGTIAAVNNIRGVLQQVVESGHAESAQLSTGDHLHRDRHVLEVFLAAGGGDNYLLGFFLGSDRGGRLPPRRGGEDADAVRG